MAALSCCVWPIHYGVPCRKPCADGQGQVCLEHAHRVRAQIGTGDCAWPGCQRGVWDRKGLCSFHAQVADGSLAYRSFAWA